MSDENKNKFSRRKFVKGLGGSILTTYAISPAIAKTIDKVAAHKEENIEGKTKINFSLNGKAASAMVEADKTLVDLLRDDFNMTGTKKTCDRGECGACTVLIDNEAVYSCHTLAVELDGKSVITIEGLKLDNKLHPIQEAFIEKDGIQCGFCTPGQIMSALALLLKNPNPTDNEIKIGMSGNICRCGAYPKIFESVKEAAHKIRKGAKI